MTAPLIEARALTREFVLRRSWLAGNSPMLRAVDCVDLAVHRGETLGLVGESGSGKSTLGRCLTRLIDTTGGTVVFVGQVVTRLETWGLRPFRRAVQMIFQDPSSSLNPRRRVGDILSEPLAVHGIRPKREIPQRLREL
ncbi:MAG TPA: ATP-binding cassette domain-containing protein, partial [Rubellimicrobium sp.]|nr:ATP-binding cassette domain-containing protein [Rubellimicrobium sp.]